MRKLIAFLIIFFLSVNSYASYKVIGNLQVTGLGGGGTLCLHVDNSGNVTTSLADCGLGGVNWGSIGGIITAQNWSSPTPYLRSDAINWVDINLVAKIGKGGLNWTDFPAAGFVKWNGSSAPTADTNTYLTTASASATYVPQATTVNGHALSANVTVTNSDLGATPTTRNINTTAPLTGGGDMSADRTIAMPAATNSNDGYLTAADHTTFASATSGGWTLGASNVGISTTNNVGIGTNLTTTAGLTVMNGNVGIGTWVPAGKLDIGSGASSNRTTISGGSISINSGTTMGANGFASVGTAGGTVYTCNGNAITTGVCFSGSSTSTGVTTGDMFRASITGLGANGTGLNVGIGTQSVGTGVLVVNQGTGYTVRFNSALNDTAPTIIDANGNVGINTTTALGSFIVASGNVGIGSLTPGDALDLSGGNIRIITVGKGLKIKTGSNAKMGTATLSSGTVTVSTTAVTSTSEVFLTDAGGGVVANIGSLYVGTIINGTSFVIGSSNALDSSNVNWIILDPS